MYSNRKRTHSENDRFKKNKHKSNEELEELKLKKPMQKSEYMAMAFGVQPKELEYSKYILFMYPGLKSLFFFNLYIFRFRQLDDKFVVDPESQINSNKNQIENEKDKTKFGTDERNDQDKFVDKDGKKSVDNQKDTTERTSSRYDKLVFI